jgi:hypothetical protein
VVTQQQIKAPVLEDAESKVAADSNIISANPMGSS